MTRQKLRTRPLERRPFGVLSHMAEEDIEDEELGFLLETVPWDGAYVHYVEGFVSMIFFQDKTIPTFPKNANPVIKGKRIPVIEVRMPIPSARRLASDINNGFTGYQTSRLAFGEQADQWTGIAPKEFAGVEQIPTDVNFGLFITGILQMTKEKLPEKGQIEYNEFLVNLILSHIDDIRKITEKYPETKGMFDDIEKKYRKVP
jgi:hypothetical protein